MGIVLELGKLVTASWLYHYWKRVPKLLKGYLISAVVVLMFITSMGIFGFLSKAHIEQTTITSDKSIEIQSVVSAIERHKKDINRAEFSLSLLDDALKKYTELGAVTKGLNARKDQEVERNELNKSIQSSTEQIATLTKTKFGLQKEQLQIESEVGPIRYIAELIYGESSQSVLEDAVRWVIIIIVFVFDPLAVLLLISANITLKEERTRKRRKVTRTRKRQEKKDQTAWERKLKETKENQGGLTKVVHENNGMKAEYYE
jgi:septal ring factor EnvC (AmiA/AmiB activator)